MKLSTPLPEKIKRQFDNDDASLIAINKINQIITYIAELTEVVEALQSPSFREVTSPDLTRGIDISDKK